MTDAPSSLPLADPVARRQYDVQAIMGMTILVGVFIILVLVLLGYAKAEPQITATILTGAGVVATTVVAFFFRTSNSTTDRKASP